MELFRKLRVLRRFPFWVVGGTATWVVTGSDTKLRRFLKGLSGRVVPQVRVEAIHGAIADFEPLLLTPREGELFRRAIRDGYFEVPRHVSLTELARRVHLAKSTLSRTLAVAERKLLTRVEEAGPSPPHFVRRTEPVRPSR